MRSSQSALGSNGLFPRHDGEGTGEGLCPARRRYANNPIPHGSRKSRGKRNADGPDRMPPQFFITGGHSYKPRASWGLLHKGGRSPDQLIASYENFSTSRKISTGSPGGFTVLLASATCVGSRLIQPPMRLLTPHRCRLDILGRDSLRLCE